MKAILMSIKPQHVANILNGIKTLEIRKKFPIDYVGWVYIYCTKDNNNLLHKNCIDIWWIEDRDFQKENKRLGLKQQPIYNGKVVARFWCDNVKEIPPMWQWRHTIFNWGKWLIDKGCVSQKELFTYLKVHNLQNCGYAIHITKLEIFDKPKEISEFMKVSCKGCPFENTQTCHNNIDGRYCKLTRAPQSYQFIEI